MKRTVRVWSVLSAFGVLLAGSAFAAFDWGTFTGTELVIPVGETVVAGNGQVATLNALTAITIPATSELKVSGTTTAVELSAAVTGVGKLSFDNVSKVTLSGDNIGFTGEFLSQNTYLRINSVTALGNGNKVTHYTGLDNGTGRGKFEVNVNGELHNEFHFIAGAGGYGVYAGSNTAWLYGKIYTEGPIEFGAAGGYMRIAADVDHAAGSPLIFANKSYPCPNAALIDLKGEDAVFVSGALTVNSNNGLKFNCGDILLGGRLTWYGMAAGIIPATTSLCLGYGSSTTASLIDAGAWTVSNVYYRAGIDASNVKTMTSVINRSFTVTGRGPDIGMYTSFAAGASITYDCKSAEPGTLLLIHPDNAMSGTIAVKRGTLALGAEARFPNVTAVSASGEGVLELRGDVFDSTKAVLTFPSLSSGTVRVPAGVTAKVNKVVITDGTTLRPGRYRKESAPFQMEGDGVLEVVDGNKNNYVVQWKSGAAGDFYDTANWDRTPRFDGTETFYLDNYADGRGGDEDVITLTKDFCMQGFICRRSRSLRIVGATGNERIVFGCGADGYGTQIKGTCESGAVTNTFEVPIAIPGGTLLTRVQFQEKTYNIFKKPWSGGDLDVPLEFNGTGGLEFCADSPDFLTPFFFNEKTPPRPLVVRAPFGLGSPDRMVKIEKDYLSSVHFCGPAGATAVTNEVPMHVRSGQAYGYHPNQGLERDDLMFVEDPANVRFVQKGKFSITPTDYWYFRAGNYTFLGGIEVLGAKGFKTYPYNGGHFVIAGQPLVATNAPVTFQGTVWDVAGRETYHFDVAGNLYDELKIHRVDVRCGVAGTLNPTARHELGLYTGYTHGAIDLNGFDQTIGELCSSVTNGVTAVTKARGGIDLWGEVRSATPATLTLKPSAVVPYAAIYCTNRVSLVMDGAPGSEQIFTHRYSHTDGDLAVKGGTLTFQWGAGWGGPLVSVTGGTLRIGEGSGDVAFGRETKADLAISGGGKVEIAAGERAVVGAVTVNGVALTCGRWGGPGSAAPAAHQIPELAGTGVLRVTKGEHEGLGIIVR